MTLVDSSVWIDFLRDPGLAVSGPLAPLVRAEQAAMTEPIAMELLMGPTDELAVRRIERIIGSVTSLAVDAESDFASAASIFRAVRRTGRTVRSKLDCLIAAVALRHGVQLLHRDADFATIAAVTGLVHRDLREDA